MEQNLLITIGLPFYNNANTLTQAIKSILLQTYQNWELILLNDGSTDGSLEIARSFGDLDQRIHVVNDGLNKGLVFRLNQVIELAKGKYIARMDADDMMMPQRLEKQLKCFFDHPNLDIVASAAYTIDHNDQPIGIRGTQPIGSPSGRDVIKSSLLIHPTILVRSEWCKVNKYDPAYVRAEDYELWCRTFSYTKFYKITEPLFIYREGNVNINNYLLSMITLRKIFRKYGANTLSNFSLKFEILKTYLKGAAYKIMGKLNLQYLLTAKRNSKLSENKRGEVNQIISNIKNS